jgi:gag-polypeptide of LTR copia-type
MTDSHEDKEGVPRLLRFSGKQADWRMWSQKFKARAKIKKYLQILTGVDKAPSALAPGDTETQDEEKERLVKSADFETGNGLGYSELLSTVFDDISFCIVDEAKTDILPDGDLYMAWKGLLDMYEPSTPSTRLALKKEFQNSQLSSVDQDPDIWITELELMRKRLKTLKVIIEDEDFVMQVINNLPMEYDSLVEAIEEDMNKELEDQITVKRVRERIRARY